MPDLKFSGKIPPWLARSLAAGLCLLPPLVLAFLLWRDTVNIPYWDEWDDDIAGLIVKFKTGILTFGDLWAQHNESRFVLLRIFVLMSASLSHWNPDCEVAATFMFACMAAWAVFRLEATAFAEKPVARWAVFFISSLLIFSPAQSEAWLWGMEMILYLPLLCILLSLLMLRSKAGEMAKWFFCAAMAVIGTYSFCNGLLVWAVLFPVMFLAEGREGFKKKLRSALCWLLAFFGNAAVYFHRFKFSQPNGFWQMLWANPWEVAQYFFVFLGGPLTDRYAAHFLATATIIGFMVSVLFVAVCLCLLRWRKEPGVTSLAAPWLAVGFYGFLSALLATMGRSGYGAEQALSQRYGIFGISLLVALTHLVPILAFHGPVKKNPLKPHVSRPHRPLAALGAVVIFLHLLAFPSNIFDMYVFRLNLLLGKAGLQFLQVLPPQPSVRANLFPIYSTLEKNAEALNAMGVRNDDFIKTARLAGFSLNAQSDCGAIEFNSSPGNVIYISGWAVSADHKTAADCVLFTYESGDVQPEIFALMDSRFSRADLAARFHNRAYLAAGWQKTIGTQDFPRGKIKIKAWAYDVQTRQITPLQNEILLEKK